MGGRAPRRENDENPESAVHFFKKMTELFFLLITGKTKTW
jgi:hypothetical protein